MASTSHRASLEPLLPALVGIGLLHVLGGMMLWIVMPTLSEALQPRVQLPANLVWRTPEDFVGAAPSAEPLGLAQAKSAAPVKTAPARAPKAGAPAAAAVAAPAEIASSVPAKPSEAARPVRIEFTPAGKRDSSVSLAPNGLTIVPPGQTGGLQQLPPDTLTMLQNSLGSSAGMETMKAGLAAQILGASPPPQTASVQTPPPSAAEPQESAPPAKSEAGREANKYITLSAVSDQPPMPVKPTLNLLDIATLNDIERARKGSAATGLDAVDSAIQQTLMRAWVPPSIDLVPAHQRRASVELSVLKDGTVKKAVLVSLSGSSPMDASVRAALARVTKIPESLPATYDKESYAVRVNLQIE